MAEEIWHHGIKGMRWGVRRTPDQLGNSSSNKSKSIEDVHPDHVKAHDSKSVSSMSDAELRSRLNRINMERQYSQLNPTGIQKGRKAINSVIKTVGTVGAISGSVISVKSNWNTISGWFKK